MISRPGNGTVYALAWPIAMNAMLQQAILIIDTILVGGLGEEALAAMGIASSIAGLIVGVLFAMSNGTQILIAQAYGASSTHAQRAGFWSGLIVALCIALAGIAGILLLHNSIIERLAKTAEIASLASDYLVVFTVVLAGVAICQHISVYFYATGKPRLPLYSKLLELPFNAALSYALIYGAAGLPPLGLTGAALGSAAAVTLRAVFLIACMGACRYRFLWSRCESGQGLLASVSHHLSNALPIGGTFISMNLAFTVCLMIYSQLQVHEFAALTILFLWVKVGGMLVTAWAQATGILVGQLLGQGRLDWLDRFVAGAWRQAFALAVLVSVIHALTPWLFGLLYPNLEGDTVDVVWALLPILILLPLARSSNTMCGNILRAGGQAAYAFKVHVSAQWLFTVPTAFLFVVVLELPVVWVFSIPLVEECLKALPFHLRIRGGSWKRRLLAN